MQEFWQKIKIEKSVRRHKKIMLGTQKIEWADSHMKVLSEIKKKFAREKPFDGLKISICMHLEAKTAVLIKTLAEGGAEIYACACNPLTADDDVCDALRHEGFKVFARRGESEQEYWQNIEKVIKARPDIIIDDGADTLCLAHEKFEDILKNVLGANEETTTGVTRLKKLEKENNLKVPVFAVNDAYTKFLFDNRYGTGQSTIDGLLSATNLLIAGKCIVVAGYGWCGRGIALRLKGMGARVIITEVDEIKALEALMDGFDVMPMGEACKHADIIITATGCIDVVRKEHFLKMKDGCILANAGHFNVEINIDDLEGLAKSKRRIREYIDEYVLKNGKRIYLLGEGRLVNLVCGQGHPCEVMDLSFSLQALCAEYIAKNYEKLENKVYKVPSEIDRKVAKLMLKVMNVKIDKLNKKQKEYLGK